MDEEAAPQPKAVPDTVLIRFTRNRLLVGYSDTDWSPVWYESDLRTKNDEDETEVLLYAKATGVAQKREPMPGEIQWLPHFDPASFRSKKPAERERMHKRTLTDIYEYLVETDEGKVRALEKAFVRPGDSRWQTLFAQAKKFKKIWFKRRQPRRQHRVILARAAGATDAEIEAYVNSDSSDSAYESGDEVERRSAATAAKKTSNKRKQGGNGPRSAASAKSSRLSQNRSSLFEPPYMSGGLGFQMPGRNRSDSVLSTNTTRPRTDSHEPDDNDSDDEITSLRDSAGPPPIKPGITAPWNFDHLTPPPSGTPRTLGRSPGRASLNGISGGLNSRLLNGQSHQSQEANEGENDIEQAE